MARKKITDLLGEELTESESIKLSDSVDDALLMLETPVVPGGQNSKVAEIQTFEVSKSESKVFTESVTNKIPKYLTLERKEVRLPSEHIDELTRLVRRLNRQRKGKDERITENTLIRVAVSLLADFGEKIEGNNESELLDSLRKAISE
jgi:hypothetical protein